MKIQIYLLILCVNFGCTGPSARSNPTGIDVAQNKAEIPQKIDANETQIQHLLQLSDLEDADTYEMTKRKIELLRNQLNSKKLQIDSIGKIFEESLLHKIIPFWEGTAWSFEGHTSKPKSGEIACGYFVSTTLQDVGLNLNRYQLAQQSPLNEAKSLALNAEVKEISEEGTADNISAIKKYLKEGIHFIGFEESHVGFILKRNGELYLIHSNYINAAGVEIEPIEQSEVFLSYDKYVIVELSTNEKLLSHWKNNEPIEIIKN